MVMERLKNLDHIAYIRFASVYREFADITTLKEEVDTLASTTAVHPANQLPLLPREELAGSGKGSAEESEMSAAEPIEKTDSQSPSTAARLPGLSLPPPSPWAFGTGGLMEQLTTQVIERLEKNRRNTAQTLPGMEDLVGKGARRQQRLPTDAEIEAMVKEILAAGQPVHEEEAKARNENEH